MIKTIYFIIFIIHTFGRRFYKGYFCHLLSVLSKRIEHAQFELQEKLKKIIIILYFK